AGFVLAEVAADCRSELPAGAGDGALAVGGVVEGRLVVAHVMLQVRGWLACFVNQRQGDRACSTRLVVLWEIPAERGRALSLTRRRAVLIIPCWSRGLVGEFGDGSGDRIHPLPGVGGAVGAHDAAVDADEGDVPAVPAGFGRDRLRAGLRVAVQGLESAGEAADLVGVRVDRVGEARACPVEPVP